MIERGERMSYDIGIYRYGLKDKETKVYYPYDENITYNVREMLEKALGPDHLKKWNDCSFDSFQKEFRDGWMDMTLNPKVYKKYEAPNGWGTYDVTLIKLSGLGKALSEYSDIDGAENVYLSVWW